MDNYDFPRSIMQEDKEIAPVINQEADGGSDILNLNGDGNIVRAHADDYNIKQPLNIEHVQTVIINNYPLPTVLSREFISSSPIVDVPLDESNNDRRAQEAMSLIKRAQDWNRIRGDVVRFGRTKNYLEANKIFLAGFETMPPLRSRLMECFP